MEGDDILIRFTLNDTAEITNTGEEIGRGAYGRVFKVLYYGTVCAAKEIHSILLENVGRQELERTKTTYLRECCQCCALRHPNIVQFLGLYYPPYALRTGQAGSDTELPVIVMELMQGSLKYYIESAEQNNTTISYLSKLSILQDVAQGLRYLHHQNPPVVHRDLSPNNILLNTHLVAKISDLGVAKAVKLDNKHTMTKVPGTADFMPPEALEDSSKYGPPLDIFSYGGVTLFVISQEWPMLLPVKRFDQNLNRSVLLTEIERRQKYVDKMMGNAEEIKPLVLSCLSENPMMRPAIAEVLEKVKELKCHCEDQEMQSQQQQHQFLSYTQCKSDGCSSEMVQGYHGYCVRCHVTNHSSIQQEQQQQQQQKPSPRQRPQVKPRSNPPVSSQPASLEVYEYVSSKEVPPAEEETPYDDYYMLKPDPYSILPPRPPVPPRPPIQPRYTVQSTDVNEGNTVGDLFDNEMDRSPSPPYIDARELNTNLPRGGSVDSPPPPPKCTTNLSNEKSSAHYMSPAKIRQARVSHNPPQKHSSPCEDEYDEYESDLISVLKHTSQDLPDQMDILNLQDEYIITKDKKWAWADPKPHSKQLDDFNDPMYQIQKEAFTIQKEALSDFREIGKGQYGVVEAALYRPSPGSAPIKVVIKETKEMYSQLDEDNFFKEIVVMAQFIHPNIVRVFGSVVKGVPSPWLVLEFLPNGDLKTFLKRNSRSVFRLIKYMVDIAMGMHYLSEKDFVHRDLAARNIFMDENELCKVGGFEDVPPFEEDDDERDHYIMGSKVALPVRWMALECLTQQIFSSASDVWSFGILMWELFNPGARPYRSMDNMTVIAAVSAGNRLDVPEKCPQKVGQVMQACWSADMMKRPSFLMIVNLLCRCIQQEIPSST